jgi:AraC-like DNA-binding protein
MAHPDLPPQRCGARVEETGSIEYAALASELGFSDQAHFTRDFTTVVGTSPARYPG